MATWRLTGVGEVRFRRSNGKVLRRSFASPPTKNGEIEPVLEWNNEGKGQTFRGYGKHQVQLPSGDELTAEIVPWEQRWRPNP
jgi:hypothetical protein